MEIFSDFDKFYSFNFENLIYLIFRTFDSMGLTKQYLRYASANIFGIVAGSRANIKLIKFKGVSGKYAAVGACEYVFIWDLKTGENVSILNYFNGYFYRE